MGAAFLYQVIAHIKWDEGSILRYNKNMKQTAGGRCRGKQIKMAQSERIGIHHHGADRKTCLRLRV